MSQVDVDAVKAAAPISSYLCSRGFEPRRVGSSWRCACPFCGGSDKATKFCIRQEDDFAKCFDCGWSGDVIDLVQAHQKVEFREAVNLLGGDSYRHPETFVKATPVTSPVVRSSNAETEADNFSYWESLSERHREGEAYLAKRRLEGLRHPETLRFDCRGGICVPLRSTTDGRIVNIATRSIRPQGPKVRVRRGHAIGCFGDVRHLRECHGAIVLVEGLTDYLTALALFPSNLPLGANGASRMSRILDEIADRLHERHVWIAADNDNAGERAVEACVKVATSRGIPAGSLERISLKTDLNETLVEVLL